MVNKFIIFMSRYRRKAMYVLVTLFFNKIYKKKSKVTFARAILAFKQLNGTT